MSKSNLYITTYNFPCSQHLFLYNSSTFQTLQTLTQLPAILKEEEDEAYNNEAGPNETDDIINKQHNAAVRTIAIGHIVDKVNLALLIKENKIDY